MKSALLFTLGLSAALLHAQVPAYMSYQGRVSDPTGVGLGTGAPVNRRVIFRIYDSATGANRLWSEAQTVTMSNGEFSVLLGQGEDAVYSAVTETPHPALPDVFSGAGTDRYLELVVDNGDGTLNGTDTPISPRQRLTSTTYSFRAKTADSIAPGSTLQLNNSADNGLGWYGTGRLFGGSTINGPVLFGAGGGALGSASGASQTTALRWDNSGRVGVGGIAANAAYTLDVSGSAHTSGNLFVDGNLGIGNSSPERKLHVGNYESGDQFIRISTAGGNQYRAGLEMRHYDNDWGFSMYHDERSAQGWGLHFASSSSGTVTDRMFISSGGDVGIGTTSPGAKLDVVGQVRINDSGLGAPTATGGGGGGMRLVLWPGTAFVSTPYGFGMDAGTLYSVVPDSASHKWYGGTTQRMSLNGSNGNLTVGGSLSTSGSINPGGGIMLTGGFTVDANYGGSTNNFISFAHTGVSEDYMGYANNTFYFRDSPGGGDSATPAVKIGDKSVPVAEEELRIVRGTVAKTVSSNFADNTSYPSGTNLLRGSGYRFKRNFDDEYEITFDTAFSDVPTATMTPIFTTGDGYNTSSRVFIKIQHIDANKVIFRTNSDDSNSGHHCSFSFIVVGPR